MKIPCETIVDLIPLVVDDVSSKESKQIVVTHIEECPHCKDIYETMMEEKTNHQLVEKTQKDTLILQLQKRILMKELLVLMIGMVPALCLLEQGMLMFYNIVLIPCIGCLSYFNLGKRWYYTPIGIFIICFLYEVLIVLLHPQNITPRFAYSFVFALLSVLGVLLGFLLQYAFGKERSL